MSSDGGESAPWLGLLKWSLQYTDGTKPSTETMSPMTTEDRAFLEAVMKDGVIDPAKRMKEILARLNIWLRNYLEDDNDENKFDEDDMVNLLEEVHEIVENIDFARDFVKMNGVPFLLGCSSEKKVPRAIRMTCLNISSTISQNNPPVQDTMLREHDALNVFVKLYFTEMVDDQGGSFRKSIIQAISCMVRSHRIGEDSFCASDSCRFIIEEGIGCHSSAEALSQNPCPALWKKCVFLLKALLHSDFSTPDRIKKFKAAIKQLLFFLDPEVGLNADVDLKEMVLYLLLGLLKDQKNIDSVKEEKEEIVNVGVSQIKLLRAIKNVDEIELNQTQLEVWEQIFLELAKFDVNGQVGGDSKAPPLMISNVQ